MIILASGDMWQGSSESNNTKGKLATEWLNYIGCSSMTLGNHEFDWKTDKIKTNAELAKFPFLAINVYERATNQRVAYCRSSVMVKKTEQKSALSALSEIAILQYLQVCAKTYISKSEVSSPR